MKRLGSFDPALVAGQAREPRGSGFINHRNPKSGTKICGCGSELELRHCHGARGRSRTGPKPSGHGRNFEIRAYVSERTKSFVDADDIKAGAIVETVVSAAMRAGVVSVRTILEQVEQWYSRENCNAAAA